VRSKFAVVYLLGENALTNPSPFPKNELSQDDESLELSCTLSDSVEIWWSGVLWVS